jgi:iron-sulfur cluster repair protein YtfE (RIC family)
MAEAMDHDRAERARDELLDYLKAELVPHARAEEETLYRAAAAQPEGRLLIEGMLAEHRAITSLVEELDTATAPVRAAAIAGALAAVFATHLTKENDLVVPLIGDAGQTSLADLLAGMHALLGPSAHP